LGQEITSLNQTFKDGLMRQEQLEELLEEVDSFTFDNLFSILHRSFRRRVP
jgi:hypothetical protein